MVTVHRGTLAVVPEDPDEEEDIDKLKLISTLRLKVKAPWTSTKLTQFRDSKLIRFTLKKNSAVAGPPALYIF